MNLELGNIDRRRQARYEANWKVSVMKKFGAEHEIYRDQIRDISLCGTGILADTDIYTDAQLVILLETPLPLYGVKRVIAGIECKMCKPEFLADHGKFHIGFDFVSFHGIDKHLLAEALFRQSRVATRHHQELDRILR